MAVKDFNYEEAVAELENIVAKLSEGNISLDESLALYTRGVELSDLCQKRLIEVVQKISKVNKDGSTTIVTDNGEDND